jgi:hypothetical protein
MTTVPCQMIKALLLQQKHVQIIVFTCSILILFGITFVFQGGRMLDFPKTVDTISPTTSKHVYQTKNITIVQRNDYKPTAIVHVGPYKTGSTTIQLLIMKYLEVLKNNDSYGIPGEWTMKKPQSWYIPSCYSERIGHKRACQRSTIPEEIDTIGKQQHNLLLSAESFSHKEIKVAKLKRHLTKYYEIDNIHIVAYYRRYYDWLVSWWNQQNKRISYYDRPRLVDYFDVETLHTYFSFGPYVYGASKHWSQHFPNVTIHNMLAYATKSAMVDEFFCNIVPRANATCTAHMNRSVEERSKVENPSRELVYDDLVFVAIRELKLNFSMTQGDKSNIVESLASKVKYYQETTLQLTQFDFDIKYKKCPEPEVLQLILNYTLQAEQYFFPDFYNSDKGRQDILSKFDRDKTAKLCTIDIVAVIKDDTTWQIFFKELESEHNKNYTVHLGV